MSEFSVTPLPDPTFVHLRLHSEFSVSDGIVRIDAAIDRALADGMPALALTDLANLFGAVKFYTAARDNGIKPIIGCDVWIADAFNPGSVSRALFLCVSHAGYVSLCQLLSRAYRENQRNGRPQIDKEWLAGAGSDLIVLSGAQTGDVGIALSQNNLAQAELLAKRWAELFPQRFYIEVQRCGRDGEEAYISRAIELSNRLRLPVVATHPVQFMEGQDYKAHEARVCIAEGGILGDRRRPKRFTEQQYFKSQAEMAELFKNMPAALANAVEIAKRCNVLIELGKNRLPVFPTPAGFGLDEYLALVAREGLEERLAFLYPAEQQRAERRGEYEARLQFEIDTIVQMGFSGYFLIVSDFIRWAKENGVPVGPGRGSGAGSLVAYSLKITDLDPLRYDLLFERFLNPERVSMPDFDIDFCQDGRERVIDYVKQKYGSESVSQIATFGTMAAKAVVRDVGRVLDLPYNFVDQLAKLIPFELGMTLKKAREQEPQLNQRAAAEEEVGELLELAERLEGMTRNVGMHAGGVLIAPGKLTDFVPLYCAQGSDSVVSQFDKDDVEAIGLVKFDFLGLRTLTIIDWAVRFIRASAEDEAGRAFSIETIALDDPATYKLLQACNTTAIFQLESRGMRDLVKQAQPNRFEDIIALVALYRPGPMNLIPDWLKRKRGEEPPDYFDPRLEPVLAPTYGVMVYQEQVMQIAQILGGYSLGSADLLRRAMGKKKPEEMAKHRGIFVAGACERGVTAKQASHLFDLMEKFAEYGFNKSHSAAYALIAYQTAYLKAHYPAHFMAATLSADMDATDKVHVFYADCVANGIKIHAPDINSSDYRFIPDGPFAMHYGLGAVKGTGEAAIVSIVSEREKNGPFQDLFDFCRRVDKRLVNRRVIESLIRAGAFDRLCAHRASLMASVGRAIEAAEQHAKDQNQSSLFGAAEGSGAEQAHALIDAPPWDEAERLALEKKALGFYFSGHPFNAYKSELSGLVRTGLAELTAQPTPVYIAGIIAAVRILQTRRGRMCFVTLDDAAAQVEVAIFGELFEAERELLKEDGLLVVLGKVVNDDFSGGLRVAAEQLFDLARARQRFARRIELRCNGNSDAGQLVALLKPFCGGECAVEIRYRNASALCHIAAGSVHCDEQLIRSLRGRLADENVVIHYVPQFSGVVASGTFHDAAF